VKSPYIGGSVVESPVALLFTQCGGRANAMTVSFFSEVAHHPTTLWVSIAKSSYTHELLEQTWRFSLIVLHRGQGEFARMCGTVSGRQQDKCAGLRLYRGADGQLYMEDSLASVSCKVRSAHPLGDHTLFIAEIVGGDFNTRKVHLRHLTVADLV
jgi:flavin reductase (DIM6/NTAB) family NADH-FMN oxidoreductase RutF